MQNEITLAEKSITLHGTGKFDSCRTVLQSVLQGNASAECTDRTCRVAKSFKKPPIKYGNLEFFGTSEFFYTMRDTLRIAGRYSASGFERAAKVRIALSRLSLSHSLSCEVLSRFGCVPSSSGVLPD